ncbi:mitogen-activated protein kinase kinase kinase 9 [Tulasnella sp. 403]|nr:mitogen-activated protein kinase kinase kinase 9 [Tulasnella sp. 403]
MTTTHVFTKKLVMEWAGLRHPNLLPLSGFFGDPLTPTDILLVYPYLPQGPLERRRGVSDYSGVRNVLINEKGCAVLCDYGLATAAQNATVPLTILDTDQVVSARYWSPEVVMGGPRDASADIWSYGCILFELDIGFAPYRKVDDMATLADVMTQHHLPSTPTLLQSLSLKQHRIKNILEMCWNLNPEQRPTIGKVVEVLEGAVFRFEVTLSIREESRLGLPLGGSVIKMLRHSASGRYLAAATTTDGILVNFPVRNSLRH